MGYGMYGYTAGAALVVQRDDSSEVKSQAFWMTHTSDDVHYQDTA